MIDTIKLRIYGIIDNTKNTKKMNWNNVDLNDNYERDQNILDPYNFDTLLLEISHNIRTENLNRESIKAEAEKQIKSKLACALETLYANLDNITAKAIEERNQE